MSLSPLKRARLEKGWSQYHLEMLSGVAQGQISYAERGYPALSFEKKKQIARIFEQPVEELFPDDFSVFPDFETPCKGTPDD